jgi:hypothetical protein
VSIITDGCYNRVTGYAQKNTIDAQPLHTLKTEAYYMIIYRFILGFFFILNSFLTTKPTQCLKVSKNSQLYTATFCPLYMKFITPRSIILMSLLENNICLFFYIVPIAIQAYVQTKHNLDDPLIMYVCRQPI